MMEEVEEFEKRDKEIIDDAAIRLEEKCDRKDMKEKRGFIKDHFYRGSKKTKHTIVKKGE